MFLVLLAYCVSSISIAYVWSFYFDNADNAYYTLAAVYFFGGEAK